ncbi:hypothetical protein ACFLTY_04405 [Chloroflexota bacterium]
MDDSKFEAHIRSKYHKFVEYERPEGEINLFASSENRKNEVIIGGRDNVWDVYCEGYIRAAEVLVDWVTQDELPQRTTHSTFWESVAYSIVFLYRHYFELRLKEMFLTCGGDLSNIDKIHSLDKLWGLFIERYCEFGTEYNFFVEVSLEETLQEIKPLDEIIQQLNEMDKKSQIFRYPVDRNSNNVLEEPLQFDVVHFKQLLGWASRLLDGWSDGIYECWQQELRARYEDRLDP